MNEYNITYFENPVYEKEISPVLKTLMSNGGNITKVIIEGLPSFDKIAKSIYDKKSDFGILPLSKVPLIKPKGIVVTALPYRFDPMEVILTKKSISEEGKILKLPEGASISVFSKMQKAQILQFRPDIKIKMSDTNLLYQKLNFEFETDAIILPSLFAEQKDEAEYHYFPLQSSEFVPRPGQGAIAILTQEDNLPLRRFLKTIHRKEISACTNIERKIQMELGEDIAVVCMKNNQGHFKISAVGFHDNEIFSYKFTSSTSLGLVENVINHCSKKTISS